MIVLQILRVFSSFLSFLLLFFFFFFLLLFLDHRVASISYCWQQYLFETCSFHLRTQTHTQCPHSSRIRSGRGEREKERRKNKKHNKKERSFESLKKNDNYVIINDNLNVKRRSEREQDEEEDNRMKRREEKKMVKRTPLGLLHAIRELEPTLAYI